MTTTVNPNALNFIFGRRSVRVYSPGDVSETIVKQLLEAAMAAPSAMTKDPWRFVVIRDHHTLAKLAGALAGGWLVQGLQKNGIPTLQAYQVLLASYSLGGILLILLFLRLSPAIELPIPAATPSRLFLGLHKSRSVVLRLSGLFALDAFAGALLVQSLMAYWFHTKYGVDTGVLGSIFFGANILAGFSALFAARIAARFGLLRTMVFTHIPSSICLILAAFSPNLTIVLGLLLVRSALSQMDVPTRTSYVMAVVTPAERTAAASVTAVPRSLASAVSPALSGALLSTSFAALPLVICGVLKIVYDLSLLFSFRHIKPPEERAPE